MKILFIGDIVGRTGRDHIKKNLEKLKQKYSPNIIIANAENAASGYGLTKKIADDLFLQGIDVLTLGNHAWDQREMLSHIEKNPNIIRAINFPEGVPGKGDIKVTLKNGKTLLIIQVMLRLFINISLDDPFAVLKKRLSSEALGKTVNGIFVDMHGEATSEKNAFGHYFDGKVTAILGTHTHVPTADARILENKTAYQTDVGMSGDYNSVIGYKKENPIHAFTKGYRLEGRFETADGNAEIRGTFIESDDNTGLATFIEAFKI
tara:strand:- start:4113 stop:4901 length:789 start_codon:yes stop_codon:yes gene_type:complete